MEKPIVLVIMDGVGKGDGGSGDAVKVAMRGTARFVGMGGAFTSLGSDISCMTQNPAGLGLYRHSDIGLTFDISMRNYKTATSDRTNSNSETKLRFDNFGYVGVRSEERRVG